MKHAFFLAVSAMASRRLGWGLSALSAGCGIALLCALYLLSHGIEQGIARNARNIDLVVGAKGSPLQLILSSVYHADIPAGNIPMATFDKLRRHPQIKNIVPIAIGDNYRGWRVVGTTPAFAGLYGATIAGGRMFEKPFEVVAGAATGVTIGAHFAAAHGLAADSDDVHDNFPFTVVGVLAPSGTAADRLLITSYQSVQKMHSHPDEDEKAEQAQSAGAQITSLLVQVRSPAAKMTLPRQINQSENVLAASPSFEMTRLSKNFGIGKNFLVAVSLGMILLSALMLFSSLASGMAARRYDLAVLRVLGASPGIVFGTVLFEGALTGLAGAVVGIGAGHAVAYLIVNDIGALQSMIAAPSLLRFGAADFIFMLLGMGAGVLAALLPASLAAKTDIAGLLARGGA